MTPLSRWVPPAVLAVALGAVAGAPAPLLAQEVAVRVDAGTVVVRDGQAYARDARSGRYERVQVRRDRNGRLVYVRPVPRRPYVGYREGYGRYAFDDEYRPPARKVDCSSNGHCTVKYFDPYYRALYGGGDRDRGRHGGRDRDRGGDGDRRNGDGDRRDGGGRDDD